MKGKIIAQCLLVAIGLMLASCSEKKADYIIGVSQCSEDIWRNWQNSEMRMEANFHEGVELRFATAHDDSKLQSQQIDDLVDNGINLLIVAPNQLSSVSPAIDRAYDKGIPVIVFERKTDSRKYTAFVSADNYEMGRQMGKYIVSRLNGKGRVMEILGLEGSSPAEERHNGFLNALKNTDVEVVATLQGDWTESTAYQAVKDYEGDLRSIDLVFGHNDRSAIGARKAFHEKMSTSDLPLFCGIDGLPGETGGIRQVRDSLLDASYIYPTRGDQLLQLALDILDGKPYEKEIMLTSALVTPENAEVLFLESDEVMRQALNLEKLQIQSSGYLQQLATQRTITLMAFVLVALLVLAMVLFWLYHRSKVSAQRERVVNNLWNSFNEALLSGKTDRIPDEYDWFAPLLGDWDCDYYDEPEEGRHRHVKGEWLFRRILEGTGVQDIFIFPSRATKETEPQPDGEYGSSFRMFNKTERCYDVVYTCDHAMKRLCFTKQGDKLVGKVLSEENAFWIFSDITADSFHWENVRIKDNGEKYLLCEIFGKRIK